MEDYIYSLTEKIAKYILSILLYDQAIPMSWGMEGPKPIYTDSMPGLEIRVHGYKHEGLVQILLNQGADTFEIRLLNEDGELKSKTEDICIQELVSVADELVEKTENYEERISSDYPILSQLAKQGKPMNVVIL